jgi:FMN reductase
MVSTPIRIVAISGNMHRPSKSLALAEAIARAIGDRIASETEHYDIIDAQPGLGAALTRGELGPEALKIVEAIERSDVLVVSTPTYKGTYPGLFKHLIDFVDAKALDGRPVVISATGGGKQHALVIEHQLRPLFGFFNARIVPSGIFASDDGFVDNRPVDPVILARIEKAAGEVAADFPDHWRPEGTRR